MSDSRDANQPRRVVDDIHHTPIAHPDTPLIFVPSELPAAVWMGLGRKGVNGLDHTAQNAVGKLKDLLPRAGLDLNQVISHAAGRA